MLEKLFKQGIFIMLLASLFFACGQDNNKSNTDENTENAETNKTVELQSAPAVCIWNALTVRDTPAAKGKYITTIYLGEQATFTGESFKDTSVAKGRKYLKVELKDGTIGWVQANFMAVDAKSYVIKDESKLYKRPDILTAGKKSFTKLQFVVGTDEKDGWIKIKGKPADDKWFSEGWVKENHLTDNKLDVTVAILANRAMSITDKQKKIDALNEIVNNSDFSSSIFIDTIAQMVNELNKPAENTEDIENSGD